MMQQKKRVSKHLTLITGGEYGGTGPKGNVIQMCLPAHTGEVDSWRQTVYFKSTLIVDFIFIHFSTTRTAGDWLLEVILERTLITE